MPQRMQAPEWLEATSYKTGGHVSGVWGVIVAVVAVILFIVLAIWIGRRGLRFWQR